MREKEPLGSVPLNMLARRLSNASATNSWVALTFKFFCDATAFATLTVNMYVIRATVMLGPITTDNFSMVTSGIFGACNPAARRKKKKVKKKRTDRLRKKQDEREEKDTC